MPVGTGRDLLDSGGVEVFNLVGGGEGGGEVDIDVGVGSCNHDRAVEEGESDGMIETWGDWG